MSNIKKILVSTDFSMCSAAAEAAAHELARTTGAELLLLHVVDDTPFLLNDVAGYIPAQEIAHAEEVAQAELEQRAASMAQDGVSVSGKVVHGSAAHEIVATAEDSHADLIVMGTHGRRGFRRLLTGSVTERVARTAKVATLTIPVPQGTPAKTAP
jgi:nucleotide-binding universal stress UspA family protein